MTDAVKMAIEALRPFAEAAGHIHPSHPDEATSLDGFPMSDFRRAAQALADLEQAGEPEPPLTTLQRLGQEFDAAPVKECLTTAADAGVTQGDIDHLDGLLDCAGDCEKMLAVISAHRLQSVAAATAAKDVEIAELAEAVRCIMARCEALEDEASNGIATTSANVRDDTHEAGFWRGQKSTAKSIREHLHDMTRAALSEAREAGDSLAAGDRV